MMPQQLPDICADRGVKDECMAAVKAMLRNYRVRVDDLGQEVEMVAYRAMMRGVQTGFQYGWRLGQNALKEEMRRNSMP